MFFCVSPSQLAIDYNNIQVTDTRTKNRGHIQGGGDKMLYLLLSISFHFRFLFFFLIIFSLFHFLLSFFGFHISFLLSLWFCFCFPRFLSSILFVFVFHVCFLLDFFHLLLFFFISLFPSPFFHFLSLSFFPFPFSNLSSFYKKTTP